MSAVPLPDGARGLVDDWSGDRQAFRVPWGKAMMWVFLLSDTFIFGSFLTGYMTVRASVVMDSSAPQAERGMIVGRRVCTLAAAADGSDCWTVEAAAGAADGADAGAGAVPSTVVTAASPECTRARRAPGRMPAAASSH